MYRILIVDSNVLFREGLCNLLRREPGIAVVGEAGSISEALGMVEEINPHLALIDSDLPDISARNGIPLLRAIKTEMTVALISAHETEELLMCAVRSGARGYLLKNHSLTKFMASIRALERGEAVIPRAMVGRLLDEFNRLTAPYDHEGLSMLTHRELEVLRELGADQSNRQIADHLTIAENTVKVHVHNILEKLDLRNRRQAARYAQYHGITDGRYANYVRGEYSTDEKKAKPDRSAAWEQPSWDKAA